MTKFMEIAIGLAIVGLVLGYITWFVEDILKIPNEDKLKNRSKRALKELWATSKSTASQVRQMHKEAKAKRASYQNIPDFNRVVRVKSTEPNIEKDSRGRRYCSNGSLFN